MEYVRKIRYNQQNKPHPFIHMNPLSRNCGSAPELSYMNQLYEEKNLSETYM